MKMAILLQNPQVKWAPNTECANGSFILIFPRAVRLETLRGTEEVDFELDFGGLWEGGWEAWWWDVVGGWSQLLSELKTVSKDRMKLVYSRGR